VDDGAATGATIIAAARWIRRLYKKPHSLIIGITIAPEPTVDLLEKECDAEVEVVMSPPLSEFHSLEQYHHTFQPVTDVIMFESQILNLL
jgi:predicted phosphoribosyltransferase